MRNLHHASTLHNGIVLPDAWPPLRAPTQAAIIPAYLTDPPRPILIDIGRQLFVDDFLIERTSLSRTTHRPKFYGGNPVLAPNLAPDHRGFAMPYSDGVWYDPDDKIFKMFYFAGSGNLSYACSFDGLDWTKPRFRDTAFRNTNTVLQIRARDAATVWMDLLDLDRTKKFKAFAVYPLAEDKWNFQISFSADGIHWARQPGLETDASGDRSTVFYNPFRRVWVKSARYNAVLPETPERRHRTSRSRCYSESPDLATWYPANPKECFWTGPDVNDPPYAGDGGAYPELYNLDVTPYESLLVGLFSWWNPGPTYDSTFRAGPNIVELGVGFSRDGFFWSRPARGGDLNAFIPSTDVPGTWNAFNTQSAGGGFLVVRDELWFYFSGRTLQKPLSGVASTGLATLRRDGFCSMDALHTEGVLTTRVLQFQGSHFFVNVNCKGTLTAEILDADGRVIPPFSRQSSHPVSVNSTLQRMTWHNAGDVSIAANRPVRIRFYLTDGSLYSFWITRNPLGASFGYVAGGGPRFSTSIDTIGGQ